MSTKPTYEELESRIRQLENAKSAAGCVGCAIKTCRQLTESPLMALPVPIFMKDTQGRYIGCNPAFSELIGLSSEQIEGKTVHDLWQSEQAEIYHEKDLELIRKQQHQIYESVVRTKTGEILPVIFNKAVLYNQQGAVTGLVGIVTNISEQKKTEQALRRQVKLQQLVARISSWFAGVKLDKLDQTIDAMLAEIGALTGVDHCHLVQFSEDPIKTAKKHRWCAPWAVPPIYKNLSFYYEDSTWWMQKIRANQEIVVHTVTDLPDEAAAEKQILQADTILSVLAVPVNYGGKLIGFLGLNAVHAEKKWVSEDIQLLRTAAEIVGGAILRSHNERALLESEYRFRTLAEAIPHMVGVVDSEGQKIYYNRRLVQFSGIKGVSKRERAQIVHPDDLPHARKKWKTALETGGVFQCELRLRRFDGVFRWFLSRSIIVHDNRGHVQGWYGTATDIDDLKQAEISLQELTRQKNEALALLNALIESAPIGIGFWDKDLKCIKLNKALADITGTAIEQHLGLMPDEVLPNIADSPELVSAAKRVIQTAKPVLNMEITQKTPSSPGFGKSWASTWFPVLLKNNVFGLGAAIVDITDQKQARDALKYNLKRFELLCHTAGELIRAPNPLQLVYTLCLLVMKFLDCEVFFNYLADDTAGRLRLNAYSGITARQARVIYELEYGQSISGCCARDGVPIMGQNIQTTSDARAEVVKSFGITAYSCHPLLGAGGKVIGTLSFGTKNREIFSPDDLSLIQVIADQVAIAIVRMRHEQALLTSDLALKQANTELEQKVNLRTIELATRNREIRELAHKTLAAMENDRKALSKELHDSIAGTLSAIMYQIEGRVEEMGRVPPKGSMPFEKILQHLRDAIKETRYISKQLRPSVLDDFGLIAAIKDSVKDFNEFYPEIKAIQRISISETVIPEDIKTVLYRIVQEALNNIGKHSHARKVEIKLQGRKNFAHLKVIDDGRGFIVGDIMSHHQLLGGYGLFSMKERVEICKGTLQIDSEPGKGTRIHASIPLKKDDQINLF